MNTQERLMLEQFLAQLLQVKGVEKDRQADELIRLAVAQQPDANYLLTQRCLMLDQALAAHKTQIEQLQHELESLRAQTTKSTPSSFLGNTAGWGRNANATTASAPMPVPMAAQQGAAYPMPAAMQHQTPVVGKPGFFGAGGGVGNVLGTVAATAAGVAGGAFLFQGIGNLMGHGNNAHGASPPVANNTTSNENPASEPTASHVVDNTGSDDFFFEDSTSDDTSWI